MVEIAMPPPAFDLARALVDADTLPAPAEPEKPSWGMPEGWGKNAHQFRQGYLTVTEEGRRRMLAAEEDRKRWAGEVKHASVYAAERRAAEAAAEAERRGKGDPKIALQAFLEERVAAEAAVAEIAGQAERAQTLVDDLEARHREAKAAVDTGQTAAAERLVEAIATGAAELPVGARIDAMIAESDKLAAKLAVARAALAQLDHRRTEANTRLTHCRRQVELAAIDTLIAEMAEQADQILAIGADLAQRRAELRDMEYFTANRYRSLVGTLPSLPAQIGQALNPVPAAVDTLFSVGDWPQRFAAPE